MKPNSLCKNANCRRPFYACAYCVKIQKWRGSCCSEKCFHEYGDQVIAARANNKTLDLLPDRLDMSKSEVSKLINKPYEEVVKITKDELSDYSEEIEDVGLSVIIDKINKDIFSEEIEADNNRRSRKK